MMQPLWCVLVIAATPKAPLPTAKPPVAPAPLQELTGLAAAGKLAEGRAAAEALLDLVAAAAPLSVSDVQVMGQPAEGLGIYSPLFGGVVRTPEVFVYAHVKNHGLRYEGSWYELHLVSDLVILAADGSEVGRDEGFGESRFRAKVPHRETFVNIALRVAGLPAGKYRLRLVLHDRIGKKDGQGEVAFEIQ